MPIFKYLVANKERKKLSGTVEAPDETTARTELNNLGFSILSLQETANVPAPNSSLTKYVFEAIDKNSKLITGTIPAKNKKEAFDKLNSGYSLTVTGIWKEGSSETDIAQARQQGTSLLQEKILETPKEKTLNEEKEEQFVKTKIETIIKQVNILLNSLDKELDLDKKAEIHQKINKLLRIKSSKNLNYILTTAEDLLTHVQGLEKNLQEKGYATKQLSLHMSTKKLLDELNRSSKPQSISADILSKIEKWEQLHTEDEKQKNVSTAFLHSLFKKIKRIFSTPPAIQIIKEQIKIYNKQLWEFAKLYFKEPAKEYKDKVKNSIKSIWKARKKAVHSLSQAKKLLKQRSKVSSEEKHYFMSFIEELNGLTGWLLAFYLIYYFISLYLTTKNFGLESIPQGFYLFESNIFKYILVIIFLLHSTTSLKVNFFRKNLIANIILPSCFLVFSIIVLLNF